MTDNRGIDLRDRLPDVVHGTVDPAVRAALDAALGGDPDLRSELAALEVARQVCRPRVPSPDVDRIVAALPKAPTRRGASVVPIGSASSARLAPWRVGRVAAAALIAAAATGVIVARRGAEREPPSAAAAVTPTPAPGRGPGGAPPGSPAVPPSNDGLAQVALAPGIADQADWSDLSDAELESLIAALDGLTGDVDEAPDDRPLVGGAAGVTLPSGGAR